MAETVRAVGGSGEITREWVAEALKPLLAGASVEGITVEPVGNGLMAEMVRIELAHDGGPDTPRSVVVKFPTRDVGSLGMAQVMRMYEREVRFYTDLAPGLAGVSVPACHAAAVGPGPTEFTLVLEDFTGRAEPGDVLTPCTGDQCTAVLTQLARFQAALWNSPRLHDLPWLADPTPALIMFDSLDAGLEPFLGRFGAGLPAEHLRLFEAALPRAGEWIRGWRPPTVVQHGDFRSDNVLFGVSPGAPAVTVIDFQTIRTGPPGLDLAYFVGSALPTADRRRLEHDLVSGYHAELVRSGVIGWDRDEAWRGYREGALYAVLVFVGIATRIQSTERGDALIVDQLRRYADMALDLDTLQAARLA